MTTAVSISSNALGRLGGDPISSFEDGGDRANLCAQFYPGARDSLLRSHPWNCAIKRVVLSPLTDTVPFGFNSYFELPGDWLRTIGLNRRFDPAPEFRMEGRRILSNSTSLSLRYVFRNEVESSWDEMLIEAMTLRMAGLLCYPITKSTSLRESLAAEFKVALQQAKSVDSMEEPSETLAAFSPLIAVRY